MIYAMLGEALKAMLANRLRSFLTMLGIMIGVAAVVLMLAIGEGVRLTIKEQVDSLGSNLFIVLAGYQRAGGVRTGSGSAPTLTEFDAKAIKELKGAAAVSPVVTSYVQLVYENNNWNTTVMGVYPDFLLARSMHVLEGGRSLDEIDEQAANRVALIGATIVKEVFKGKEPVGETIRVGAVPFTVIGVLASKGQSLDGRDQDDTVLVPLATSRRFLSSSRFRGSVRMIMVQAQSPEIMKSLEQDMRDLLRERHRITDPNEEDDFYINNLAAVLASAEATAGAMAILLGAIASISLAVGGIGIMNIMLVSVTERTKEIGIRLAIGAREKDILMQFILEATLVSVTGGFIGVLLGSGGAYLTEYLISIYSEAQLQVAITSLSVILSFGVSAAIGLFFGFYPAWKAAKLNPIDALRFQ